MKFWLIFKQSFRSFYGKIGLYLTFTIFLIISLAMIVGLFGFSYGFDKNVKDSLGHVKLNQTYNLHSDYVPTWVIEDQKGEENAAALDPGRHFWAREMDNEVTKFLIKEFNEAFPGSLETDYTPTNLAHPQTSDQLQLALLSLGLGYNTGDLMSQLQENDLYNNQLLYYYFSSLSLTSPDGNTIKDNLDIYNHFINEHRPSFSDKYFTNDVATAIFLAKIKDSSINYQIGSSLRESKVFTSPIYSDPAVTIKYQRLNRNSNLVKFKPDLIESTPWLLFSNETAPFNIIEELSVADLNNYRDFIDNYRFTYVPPKFLKSYSLNLGDTITLYGKNDDKQEPLTFVIIGTMAETNNFNDGSDPVFTVPYQWAEQYTMPNTDNNVKLSQNFAPFDKNIYLYNSEFKNDFVSAQKAAAKEYLNYFDALRPEDETRFYSRLIDTGWTENSLQSSYDLAIGLFYTLASVLSVLIIILLFVVFYFITREIINMERNTLFYLKAMGVYNSGLSLLTTFAMMIPILIGIIGGLFGALGIQKMISDIALEPSVLTFDFFKFNFPFILALVISILVIVLGFYAINLYFLRSPSLTNQALRNPGFLARGLIKTKTKVDTHLSREVRLTLAFAFKNVYKNIVTFFILSITFGLILYIVQFQSSLTSIASAYEKWNLPYKSVLYQPYLSPMITDSEDYLRSYDVINETNDLEQIDSVSDLKSVIQEYLDSVKTNGDFNWSNYFLTKNFTKLILDELGPNPTDEQINYWIDQFYPEANYQVRGQIITLVKQVTQENNTLKEQFGYNQGYNIFFGKVLTPNTEPKRDVLSVNTIYPADGTREIKSLFFEDNIDSKLHYGFEKAVTADDYIQKGTFFAKGSEENIIIKDPLRVGISSYLQTNFNIRTGDVVPIRLEGFKTDSSFDGYHGDDKSAVVYVYVSHIVKGDTIQNTFFSSQIGILNYLAQGSHEMDEEETGEEREEILTISDQEQYYKKLLEDVESKQITLSNTVFTSDMDVPFGIRNITLPFYTKTNPDKPLGSKIEDFYTPNGALQRYLESFEDNIAVFHLVTEALYKTTDQFISILVRFVIILTLFALVISLLLVTLVLLENRRIISVLKALGYRRIEITGYLISGYLLSTVLAIIASIGLSFLAFYLTKRPISQYLGMSVYYLFSWQFFLLAILLGVVFAGLMAISIATFTRYQNPKKAFAGS